jgi:hypothetical protein
MVLLGIASRLLSWFVPGTDAYAGYCMAAAGFLALAHTFTRGEHIRVTLILEHLGVKAHRALEVWSLAVGSLLAGAFAFYSTKLAFRSGLQRHLHRQRRDAAVDSAAGDGVRKRRSRHRAHRRARSQWRGKRACRPRGSPFTSNERLTAPALPWTR